MTILEHASVFRVNDASKYRGKLFMAIVVTTWSLLDFSENGVSMGAMAVHTETLNIKVLRIADLARELSYRFSVPVCVEETRWYSRKSDLTEYCGILAEKRSRGVKLVATNVTLQTALDQFVRENNDYCWQYDQTNNVYNLFPARDSPANWQVENVNVHTQSIESLFFLSDTFGLKNHGIAAGPGRGSGHSKWIRTNSITIKAGDANLRKILNQISAQLPERRFWVISEVEKGAVFWDGTKRLVKYSLEFNPVVPFIDSPKSVREERYRLQRH